MEYDKARHTVRCGETHMLSLNLEIYFRLSEEGSAYVDFIKDG